MSVEILTHLCALRFVFWLAFVDVGSRMFITYEVCAAHTYGVRVSNLYDVGELRIGVRFGQ